MFWGRFPYPTQGTTSKILVCALNRVFPCRWSRISRRSADSRTDDLINNFAVEAAVEYLTQRSKHISAIKADAFQPWRDTSVES
ncbi:hypothetical protein XELAEV_18032050mg [Xenopus laevis]|uniref:Uncharacterized protein n=1 Tax=Xenopus laevis TaxID=8355 RepID=A0A974HG84_XENLA|nr:hypothetical protein XELAEV_18032050mg [Xenopus laevis]